MGHAELRELVTALLRSKGDHKPLGQNWFQRFKSRLPGLDFGPSITINRDRLDALDSATATGFFDNLQRIIQENDIAPEDQWNMDETGFQMGQIRGTYVVFNPLIRRPNSSSTGVTKWVTIIECINRTNKTTKPYVIHMGKKPETEWLPPTSVLPDWFYTFQQRGWTDNNLGLDWLIRLFIPSTMASGKTRLLLLDN